jgi:hypothetical protein
MCPGWTMDWLVGAAGFEPPHFRIGIRQVLRDRPEICRPETFSRIDCKHRVRHPIASSSMLGCAANQQQYSPEMTGFPAPTERHCCGMIEGLGPSGILPRRLFCQCGASVVTARDAVVNRTEIRSCRRSLPIPSWCCCLPRPSTRTVPLTLPVILKELLPRKPLPGSWRTAWLRRSGPTAPCRSGAVTMARGRLR